MSRFSFCTDIMIRPLGTNKAGERVSSADKAKAQCNRNRTCLIIYTPTRSERLQTNKSLTQLGGAEALGWV